MIWQKVAGLSGSVAVGLGAYGAHGFKPENKVYEKIYDTANKYHLLHSVLLCTAPLTKRPNLFGGIESRERERERERERNFVPSFDIWASALAKPTPTFHNSTPYLYLFFFFYVLLVTNKFILYSKTFCVKVCAPGVSFSSRGAVMRRR